MRQPAVFNVQFFREAVDGVAMVAAGCQLSTHPAGTPGSNLATYTDGGGGTPNANPIVLDDDGRCALWLDPTHEYLLRLLKPVAEGSALITEFDNVVCAAPTTGVVTSVNGSTGAVTLAPGDIDYTAPTLDWFTAANVQDALDQLATRVNAPPASSVTVEDVDTLLTATDVEAALAELAATARRLPSPTGHDGHALWVNSTTHLPEWSASAGGPTGTIGAAGSVTFPGGLILKWGVSATIGADTANVDVTFPAAFPTACYVVTATPGTDNGVGAAEKYSTGIHSITATGFKVNNDASATVMNWIAIGK